MVKAVVAANGNHEEVSGMVVFEILDKPVDKTAPTGTIVIRSKVWDSFLETITFGLYTSEKETVTITAEDAESGIDTVDYLVQAGTDLIPYTIESIRSAQGWQTYNSTFTVDATEQYVVYARITDKSGNVTYLSSDGYIFEENKTTVNDVVVEGEVTWAEDASTTAVNGIEADLNLEEQFFEDETTLTEDEAAADISKEINLELVVKETGNSDSVSSDPTDPESEAVVDMGQLAQESVANIPEAGGREEEVAEQLKTTLETAAEQAVEQISIPVEENEQKRLKGTGILTYLDIELKKTIKTTDTAGNVLDEKTISQSQSKKPIAITITVSAFDWRDNRMYHVIRVHKAGEDVRVQLLPIIGFSALDRTITFETDQFSTYILAYTDVETEAKSETEPVVEPKTEPVVEPKTEPVVEPEVKPEERTEIVSGDDDGDEDDDSEEIQTVSETVLPEAETEPLLVVKNETTAQTTKNDTEKEQPSKEQHPGEDEQTAEPESIPDEVIVNEPAEDVRPEEPVAEEKRGIGAWCCALSALFVAAVCGLLILMRKKKKDK